jgi:hypothetical protein
MASLRFDSNIPAIERALQEDAKQARYALSVALNDTAKDAKAAHVDHLMNSGEFSIRRPAFARRASKIDFAQRKAPNPTARVYVEPPGGPDRADVWTQHEEGGQKRPHEGASIMVPTDDVKRTKKDIIPKSAKPSAYNFKPMGGSPNVLQGDKRTFLIRGPNGTGGVFQRTGKKATKRKVGAGRRMVSDLGTRKTRDMNIRKLYGRKPRVTLLRKLGFHDVTLKAARASLEANFDRAFTKAMATKR